MPARSRKTVLISEPQASNENHYLPYMWAVLKTWCERQDHLKGHIEWLDPVHWRDEATVLLAAYTERPPDVLGLSCYIWNWELQCQIAERAKHLNPECVVVAGGPQPDYKDPDFFRKFPFIDIVAVKDGEITFSKVLTKVIAGDRDYGDIAGLYLPNPGGTAHRFTGPPEVPTTFDHSPYLAQRDLFEDLVSRQAPGHFLLVWETNRGCPYACSFCDWGSNTMSKVRRFDMGRIEAEADWFATLTVGTVVLADANFGIFARDMDIADRLIAARTKQGWPRNFYYSAAKNNPERTVELARKLNASGMAPLHFLAIQHTNQDVLANVDRANISVEGQREVARQLIAHNVPTVVQLIVGLPGDTTELWKGCLTDLMDWGLHDNLHIFNYALLPNAPASEKAYRDQWETETVRRYILQDTALTRTVDNRDRLTQLDFIVKSKTFSREDWVTMKIWAALVQALHTYGLTRFVAMYLHFGHGVSYRDFYGQVIDEWLVGSPLRQRLSDHYHHFLSGDVFDEDMEIPQFDRQRLFVEPGRWAAVQVCMDFENFFDGMKPFLLSRFTGAPNLASAIEYQQHVIVLPDYDPSVGKVFGTDFDWIGYSERARRLTRHQPLGEPDATPGAMVEVADTFGGRALAADAYSRRLAWLNYSAEHGMIANLYLKELRLRQPAQYQAGRASLQLK